MADSAYKKAITTDAHVTRGTLECGVKVSVPGGGESGVRSIGNKDLII